LHDDSHDAPDELDVRRETAERPKDCRNAESRVIEAFAKHLYLNDAIQLAQSQPLYDLLLLVLLHLAVDFGRPVAALLVDGAHLAGMIHRTGGRDDLVLDACFGSKRFTSLDTGLCDVAVALRAKSHASSEPRFFSELENFVECVELRVVAISEVKLLWSDISGVDLLDEAVDHRPGERVAVDHFTLKGTLVGAEGCGR